MPGFAIIIGNMLGDTLAADADAAVDNLELETGDNFLLETGDFLLLES